MQTGKSPKMSKFQNLYKCSTPPWKETYRKRCFDRLKQSREKFMHRYRRVDATTQNTGAGNAIRDLMQEEWSQLQRENPGLDQVTEIDSVLHVFEEIQRELMEEEQAILREYEASCLLDEQSLTATIDHHLSDTVICPICLRNPLLLNKGIIFCQCGLRIDTEQDCISLANISHNLKEGTDGHSAQCGERPCFSVVNQVGLANLLLTCPACDFMYVIV